MIKCDKGITRISSHHVYQSQEFTLQELENPIPVHITESCNQVLLSMRGNNLNMAFETINQVLSRNTHYEELLSVHFLKDLE